MWWPALIPGLSKYIARCVWLTACQARISLRIHHHNCRLLRLRSAEQRRDEPPYTLPCRALRDFIRVDRPHTFAIGMCDGARRPGSPNPTTTLCAVSAASTRLTARGHCSQRIAICGGKIMSAFRLSPRWNLMQFLDSLQT